VSWPRRFALHLAAALGATGIFVAAAAVGANQTRTASEVGSVAAPATPGPTRTPVVRPERSVSGTIRSVEADAVVVEMPRGRELRVEPVPGALIRLNGKTVKLDALQPDDKVVILGQLQPRNSGFLAHAITARRK
jgi:hypothetical protein